MFHCLTNHFPVGVRRIDHVWVICFPVGVHRIGHVWLIHFPVCVHRTDHVWLIHFPVSVCRTDHVWLIHFPMGVPRTDNVWLIHFPVGMPRTDQVWRIHFLVGAQNRLCLTNPFPVGVHRADESKVSLLCLSLWLNQCSYGCPQDYLLQQLESQGVTPLPKVITNEFSAADRWAY